MADDVQIQMMPIGDTSKVIKDSAKLFVVLEGAIRDEVIEGKRFMSWYPPKAPGSSYRRTGTLMKSWNFNVKSGSGRIEGTVGSQGQIAPYNEDVQGEDQQPLFERIGWRNTNDLKATFEREVAGKIQKEIDKYFD